MTTITQVSHAMQTMLTTIAEAADAELQYTKRPDSAKFTASTLVQTLVLGWLAHPAATVEQLAQSAARVGVSVSPQAIDQRFTFATAALLRTILTRGVTHLIAHDPVVIPLLQRFTGLWVHDSTTIALPAALTSYAQGCGGNHSHASAALKCGLQLDLLTGTYIQLDLVDGRASDQRLPLNHAPVPPGTLRLADLGFFDLDRFAALDAAGAYWLSKVTVTTCVSTTADQPAGSLLAFIRRLGAVAQWDGMIWVGQSRRIQARMLVQAVPQSVADQRRRRIREEAHRKGRTPSAAALALAGWTILMTNLPAHLLSLSEALVLTKIRWQIELIFKLWKSHGLVDQWRTTNPARILCEVYAKLIAMVLQQWIFIASCWIYPDRSLVKAAQVVRDHAPEFASARARLDRLIETLETIQRVLQRTGRMNSRRTKPNTYQLLLALTTEEAEPAHPVPIPPPGQVGAPVCLPVSSVRRCAA